MSGLCVYYHHRKLRGVVEPVVGGFDLVYNNGPVKPPTSLSTSGMRRRGGCAWARGGRPLGVAFWPDSAWLVRHVHPRACLMYLPRYLQNGDGVQEAPSRLRGCVPGCGSRPRLFEASLTRELPGSGRRPMTVRRGVETSTASRVAACHAAATPFQTSWASGQSCSACACRPLALLPLALA